MILISKVFLRLLNSFDAISDEEVQQHCSRGHRSEFQKKCLFVYFLSAEIFFCIQLMTKRFRFSFQKCRMDIAFCHSFTRSLINLRENTLTPMTS